MIKSIIKLCFLFIVNYCVGQAPEICGIVLSDELSKIEVCNLGKAEVDISGYYIGVRKEPWGILTHEIPKNSNIESNSTISIEIPFLDFPFNGRGKERYKKYYLFDREKKLVSSYRIRRKG